MGENRSLDEFFAASTDSDSDGEDPDEPRDPDDDEERAAATEPADDVEAVDDSLAGGTTDGTPTEDAPDDHTDPLRTTYRWSPGGDDCPACGARAERRWRDGERFVCADCKEW